MIVDEVQKVPLKVWNDGSIRVGETSVPVDNVIGQYLNGEIPEAIAEMFPALNIADIYSTISYYLTHKLQMDDYLSRRDSEAKTLRREIESSPGYAQHSKELRENIFRRWNSLNRKPSEN